MPHPEPLSSPEFGRLTSLRRLYHHVVQGGQPTPRDERWLGEPVTTDNLSRQICELEWRNTPASAVNETIPFDLRTALEAAAALLDEEIDTSAPDTPEVRDWTGAVRRGAHKPSSPNDA